MGKRRDLSKENIASMISLYKAETPTKEIAKIVGVSERSVQLWTKRFRDAGERDTPHHKGRPGKARRTSDRTLLILKREVTENPRLTARMLKEQNPHLLDMVSVRTVSRRLHDDLDFRSHRPVKQPLLTLTQQKRRVAFARKYSQWDAARWKHVLWSDEAVFRVTDNSRGNVYRRPGSDRLDPKFAYSTVKHPESLMVWGCFTFFKVGELVVLPPNQMMNQNNYLELLSDYLPSCFDECSAEVFQQDGAPCHTAKSVKQWLCDCEVDFIKDWPSNSPDLSPIENLWAIMKRRLQGKDTSTLAKLEAAIKEEWLNLDDTILQNLANSVPSRLKECIKRKGKPIDY